MKSQIKLGILWDMDGVLVDTGELHYISWEQSLGEAQFPFDREIFRETFGMNNAGILKILLGEKYSNDLASQISERKEQIFRESISGNVSILPGVLSWLEQLQAQGVKMAVASSAPLVNIEVLVKNLQIRHYFDALVSGADLPGKPDPATFLEAARQIQIDPAYCVVVEDAIAGVQAARTAGMKCIAITNTNPSQALSKADLVVDSLEDLPVDAFSQLLLASHSG